MSEKKDFTISKCVTGGKKKEETQNPVPGASRKGWGQRGSTEMDRRWPTGRPSKEFHLCGNGQKEGGPRAVYIELSYNKSGDLDRDLLLYGSGQHGWIGTCVNTMVMGGQTPETGFRTAATYCKRR